MFGGNETSESYPKGCYVLIENDVATAYWNMHATGDATNYGAYYDARPICKACNGKMKFLRNTKYIFLF